jgi:hypothetical protein
VDRLRAVVEFVTVKALKSHRAIVTWSSGLGVSIPKATCPISSSSLRAALVAISQVSGPNACGSCSSAARWGICTDDTGWRASLYSAGNFPTVARRQSQPLRKILWLLIATDGKKPKVKISRQYKSSTQILDFG